MKILIDTGAFLALKDRSDRHHAAARRFFEGLGARDRLLTTSYVVDETITRLRYARGHKDALSFAESILSTRLIEVLYVDAALEGEALARFRRYSDQKLSFTDCVTIAAAHRQRADAVFAFDDDFRKVGLRTLPEA